MLLHGDAVSSRMFEMLLPLYQQQFHVILIDFLGCGQSDRIEHISGDIWYQEADQVIALLTHLHCGKAHLVGTSGGAWVAIETALKRPDLVNKVIADSFDGRALAPNFATALIKERAFANHDVLSSQYFAWCHGVDWQEVVDANTNELLACAN